MIVKHTLSLFALTLLTSISTANAATIPTAKHLIVAPNCLLTNKSSDIKTLSSADTLSLLEVNDAGIDQLIAAKKHQDKTVCGGFMDVTEEWNAFQKQKQTKTWSSAQKSQNFLQIYEADTKKSTPTQEKTKFAFSVEHEKEVNSALKQLNPQNMWTNLTTLSDFRDRYAGSNDGVRAAEWLKTQMENMAATYGRSDDITAYFVKTGTTYKQPSLVIKYGKQQNGGVVIGAHMDTLSGQYSKKPGADDDGTGSVTVLEVARTLFESGMKFKRPIYFIWYAAEEEGLVGSGYVVKDFQNKDIPVDAVLHFDMTGYASNNDPTIWLINDYTDKDLTTFLENLVNTYVKKPVDHTYCGYACSDHATWHKRGYRSAIAFEAKFGDDNPNIHTSRDTMEWLSLDHMTSYAKIGVAFAVELAEPISE